jgi:hypothetical protein
VTARDPRTSSSERPVPERVRDGKHSGDGGSRPPSPRRCSLYFSGHNVHWIQANRSAGKPARAGRLTVIEGNVITVSFPDESRRYRNHDPDRLLETAGIGAEVHLCEEYCALRFDLDHWRSWVFSIRDAEKSWVPCDDAPLRSTSWGELARRLETHGGFTVAGRLLTDAVDDGP